MKCLRDQWQVVLGVPPVGIVGTDASAREPRPANLFAFGWGAVFRTLGSSTVKISEFVNLRNSVRQLSACLFSIRAAGTHFPSFIRRNARLLCAAFLLPALSAGLQGQTAHFSGAESTLGFGFGIANGVAVDGSGNVFVADPGNNSVKEILAAGGYTTVNTLGSGFSYPEGVAVDGSGNVFVADNGNGAVKEIPPGCTASSCVKTLGSGFAAPESVALDGNGNVFVADPGNNSVKEILAVGGYTTVNTLGSGFSYPGHVAVDGSGNVFATETGNNAVKELLAAGGYTTVNTLGSFSEPTGVAVDGSGNVFVGEFGNNAVQEILAAGGYTTVQTLGSFSEPLGAAVDASGNLYVVDCGGDSLVKMELASVDFGTVAIGQTSVAISLTFTFDSGGTIGSPGALTQGAAGLDFAVASGGTCTQGTNYSAGAACTVSVTFTPKAAGTRYGATVLKDSSGNTIATGYVHGVGSGPQVNFWPGSQSELVFQPSSSGTALPQGVAVDGSGNIFVVDFGNNAVREILAASAYTTAKTLAGSYAGPTGVAIDGGGNVFVADGNASSLYEVLASGGYTTVNTLISGSVQPGAVAVDGSGNVFISDSWKDSVQEIVAAGGYQTVRTLGSGFNGPRGVAVDGSGNVFVADSGNNAVKEILAAGGYTTVNTLGSGFLNPVGAAVDGRGNVFVADHSNYAVKEILAAGGYTTVNTLATISTYPEGVAVDGSGNVFFASFGASSVVKLDLADAPGLSLGNSYPGVKSAEQMVTLSNIGNAPLTFPVPATGNNPSISPNYTLDNSAATSCPVVTASSSAESLAAGTSCTLSISFEPPVVGNTSGSLVLTDNELNAAAPSYATQTIELQGTGIEYPQTISFPNPGTQIYGAPLTLTATASSGLPVNYQVTSGPATVSGGTLTFTGVGPVTVQATQAGKGTYAAAKSVSVSFTVNQAVLTVGANNASRLSGASNPAFVYTITGFANGDTSAAVSGTASLTTTATASSPVGTYPITFATASLTASNYSFTYVSGTLVVYSASSPLPLPISLSSSTATAGGASFTLTVNGANFVASSVLLWNSAVRATTYVSSTELTTVILGTDIAQEGTNLVTVANFAPNPGTSSALPFAVMSSTPVATISGGTISVAADGSGNRVLTLTGTDFVSNSAVEWSGANLTTTYISPWKISAELTAAGIAMNRPTWCGTWRNRLPCGVPSVRSRESTASNSRIRKSMAGDMDSNMGLDFTTWKSSGESEHQALPEAFSFAEIPLRAHFFSPAWPLILARANLLDALFQHIEGEIGLLLGDDQRRAQAQGVGAAAEEQHSLFEGHLDYVIALFSGGSLGVFVGHKLDADHQATSANIAHQRQPLRPVVDAVEDVLANLARVAQALALDDVDGGHGGGDGHRITAKGGGMRTGNPIHDFRARDQDRKRQAAGDALGHRDHVRSHAGVFDGPPPAGASHARLHFVDDQQDAVLVADVAQFLQKRGRRRQVSALALEGFHHDGGALLGRNFGAEDPVFDVARGVTGVLLRLGAGGTAIEVWIGNVHNSRNQRRKAASLLRLGAGQRERAHGASVEGSVEGDDVLAPGMVARQLERRFDGLGAGVAVMHPVRTRHGCNLRQPVGQFGELRVVEVGARHMQQLARLLLHGCDYLGMTVSGGSNGDAGGKVEELVAIHVLDHNAASALGNQGAGAGVGGRDDAVVIGDHAPCNGAGKLGADTRAVGGSESRTRWRHGFLLKQMASAADADAWPASSSFADTECAAECSPNRGADGGGKLVAAEEVGAGKRGRADKFGARRCEARPDGARADASHLAMVAVQAQLADTGRINHTSHSSVTRCLIIAQFRQSRRGFLGRAADPGAAGRGRLADTYCDSRGPPLESVCDLTSARFQTDSRTKEDNGA